MSVIAKYKSLRMYDGDRVAGFVSLETGMRMVRNETAVEGLDVDGVTPCFMVREAHASSVASAPVGLRQATMAAGALARIETVETAFTRPEVEALAGLHFRHGRSRTARMTDEQRANRRDRRGKRLPEEDLEERASNKKKAWEQLGPALKELVVVGAIA